MPEDFKLRSELEVQFAQKLDVVISQLIYSDLSDEDIGIFTNTLKTFLKFDDLKQYILDSLYDKVTEVAKIILPHDRGRFASFRKLVQTLLELGDNELIDSLETYLARNRKPDHFFLFLEEKLKKNMPYEKTEKVFIELMGLSHFNVDTVERYLEIINKDKSYIIKRLSNKDFAKSQITLRRYINELLNNQPDSISTYVIPTLLKDYNGDTNSYLEIVRDIIIARNEFTYALLHEGKWPCHNYFWQLIINHYSYNIKLVKSFCLYLEEYYFNQLDSFEDAFLSAAGASAINIVDYAVNVPTSTKRKILRRLVELKDEKQLVSFIRYFPEYKTLLPLL